MMNWTTEFPTKPGFYWLRNYRFEDESSVNEKPVIVLVSEWQSQRREGATMRDLDFTIAGTYGTHLFAWLTSAEWYGPIDPPE